jgi:hypothetical protein
MAASRSLTRVGTGLATECEFSTADVQKEFPAIKIYLITNAKNQISQQILSGIAHRSRSGGTASLAEADP